MYGGPSIAMIAIDAKIAIISKPQPAPIMAILANLAFMAIFA
jgi:hypothetical protein